MLKLARQARVLDKLEKDRGLIAVCLAQNVDLRVATRRSIAIPTALPGIREKTAGRIHGLGRVVHEPIANLDQRLFALGTICNSLRAVGRSRRNGPVIAGITRTIG
jgi:hypothetical protein